MRKKVGKEKNDCGKKLLGKDICREKSLRKWRANTIIKKYDYP
jgi:hypothetical protein